jgi:SAM-dependent methyltransferase
MVGIDILRSNVVACKGRWRNRSYVVADLNMLPFCEGAFDGVVSADVLEHVEGKTVAINELARVTRKGGFLVGCSSNVLYPILWLDDKLAWLMKPLVMKLADKGHYDRHSRFSPTSLVKVLSSTGYQLDFWSLLGYPQFCVHRHASKKLVLPWILFDKLTKAKIFLYFKEILVWQARRV